MHKADPLSVPVIATLEHKMNRAQFFSEIVRLGKSKYRQLLIVFLVSAVVLRIIDNEMALKISLVFFIAGIPAFITVVFSSLERVRELHRFYYKGATVYKMPSIVSPKLFPYSVVVPLGAMVPPFVLVSSLFGLENQGHEHTHLLSALLLVHCISVWYFWAFSPFINRLVAKSGKRHPTPSATAGVKFPKENRISYHLNDNTKNVLTDYGWNPKRKMNISLSVKMLKNAGFNPSNEVFSFLSHFGELEVLSNKDVNGNRQKFSFNVDKGLNHGDVGWVQVDYKKKIGKSLCIIGQVDNGLSVLCMSEDGCVYAGCDDLVTMLGETPAEAVEALCMNKGFVDLGECD
ncbi:MAG: hypothetical protein ACI9UJ_002440 [bacterium]